jgi:hypothetical protein
MKLVLECGPRVSCMTRTGLCKRYPACMGERIDHFLDWAARPRGLSSGTNLRVFWNSVPHADEGDADPDAAAHDTNWAASEPDPDAP